MSAPRPGFDFSFYMRRLCGDLATRLRELRHIDLDLVALSFIQTRRAVLHGMYASLTPLRFEGGRQELVRRGRTWRIERVVDDSGREMLYLLQFYLPRFFDLKFREKLITVLHELWHINPGFNGDVRRYAGRCYAHSGSQKRYDAHMARLAERWLSLEPPLASYEFLQYDFHGLVARYGRVFGRRIATPRMIVK